jgi:hypothetical protein
MPRTLRILMAVLWAGTGLMLAGFAAWRTWEWMEQP